MAAALLREGPVLRGVRRREAVSAREGACARRGPLTGLQADGWLIEAFLW